MWNVLWVKTWPLTKFNAFYLYTPLQTVVRIANAATSTSPYQVADAIMKAGALLLPDIAILLLLAMAAIVACTGAILSDFYFPAWETTIPHCHSAHCSSPIQQRLFRRVEEMAECVGLAIKLLTVQPCCRRRTNRTSGNQAWWTARWCADRLTR
jgi:hypothetical protein